MSAVVVAQHVRNLGPGCVERKKHRPVGLLFFFHPPGRERSWMRARNGERHALYLRQLRLLALCSVFCVLSSRCTKPRLAWHRGFAPNRSGRSVLHCRPSSKSEPASAKAVTLSQAIWRAAVRCLSYAPGGSTGTWTLPRPQPREAEAYCGEALAPCRHVAAQIYAVSLLMPRLRLGPALLSLRAVRAASRILVAICSLDRPPSWGRGDQARLWR